MIDDVLVGFAGVIYSSDDKKLNLWVRPGVRMPTSRVYRATGGAGYLNHQLDLSYSLSYEYSKKIEIGLFQQLRAWIYESQYGCRNRCRLVTAPYIYYSVSDSTQLQFTFEDILETDTRSLPRGDRKEHFKDVWQNLMIGVNQKITPAFNITPFVGVYVDDTPVSDESVWFGANLAYRFK